MMDYIFPYSDSQEDSLIDPCEINMDVVSELLTTNPKQELTDITDYLEDFFNSHETDVNININYNININNNDNNKVGVIVKSEDYKDIESKYSVKSDPGSEWGWQEVPTNQPIESPGSPQSWISTEDFPQEVDDLEHFESGIDSDEESSTIIDVIVPVFEIPSTTEDDLRTSRNTFTRQGSRVRRCPRRLSSPDSSSDSDPDFDPFDIDEPKRRKISVKKENTSDYDSDEFDTERSERRSRRPSKCPIPQQRKAGSKQKISQWIVTLLRDPVTNPSVITWEDEPKGKFRVVDTARYAELWGKVKRNPNMNYEKLSRAMRYYYKNKEISMVQGERLTYAFGPSMRDFHAKNRKDPNFQKIHCNEL